ARPREYEALIGKLLDQRREEPVAITAALRGAGGYGKTTMARALCHDERIQQAFDDGILWVTLGESPGNLVGKVEDLIYMLNQERPGEAVQLLSFGLQTGVLTAAETQALRDLVKRLGEWALLLKLANGVLRDRVGRG